MIKSVRIRGFKSLADVSVTLGPVTVLIGQSGSGKSNFVQAFQFLQQLLTQRTEHPLLLQLGGWGRVFSFRPVDEKPELCFDVLFEVPGFPEDFSYRVAFRLTNKAPANQLAFSEEALWMGRTVIFHQASTPRNTFEWVAPPKIAHPHPPGGVNIGSLPGVQEATLAHLALTAGLGCYSFPDAILTQAVGKELQQLYVAIYTNLQEWNRRKDITAAMQNLDPSIMSIEPGGSPESQLLITHSVGQNTIALGVDQQSEGFRRLLAYLIMLYQVPSKQVLIFEEPEKGIHPGVLEVLADQFKSCAASGRGQVILTSHSPDFLNHLPPEALRVVDMEQYRTTIGPVDQGQLEAIRERLLRPGELLTVDRARVDPAGRS